MARWRIERWNLRWAALSAVAAVVAAIAALTGPWRREDPPIVLVPDRARDRDALERLPGSEQPIDRNNADPTWRRELEDRSIQTENTPVPTETAATAASAGGPSGSASELSASAADEPAASRH